MAAVEEIVDIAIKVKPDMVTLVPEKRQELTTEGGLDVIANSQRLSEVISKLSNCNIAVSLFVDAEINQVKEAAKIKAHFIEIHTGAYADAIDEETADIELGNIASMAAAGHKLGLRVSAGHGLKYHNVRKIAALDYIEELNIGHSIIARAALVGMERAVSDMKRLIG